MLARSLLVFIAATLVAPAAPIYIVDAVSYPNAPFGVVMNGINNAGQVIGAFNDGTGFKPFIGTTTGNTLIPVPSGISGDAYGIAINSSGQVAGYVTSPEYLPFLGNTSSTALAPLPGSFQLGGATVSDINESGLAVATGQNASFQRQAYVTGTGGGTAVPLLAGWNQSNGYGINASGQIAGQATNSGGPGSQAFVGTTAGVSALLTPAGWTITSATDINDAGAVVGAGLNSGGVYQAFYTFGGVSTPIALLAGSTGVGSLVYVNNQGVVVGTDFAGAWIWDAVNGTRSLNDLVPAGNSFSEVHGFNDSGQILVRGIGANSVAYYLLTPTALGDVPEPSTWALMLSGLVGFAWKRRRG